MDKWLDETADNLNTIIGENEKMISGGERQRIGIEILYFDLNYCFG